MNIKPITVAATRPSIHGDSSSMKYNGSNQRNTKTKFKQIQKQEQKLNVTINDATIDNGESYEARHTVDSSRAMK